MIKSICFYFLLVLFFPLKNFYNAIRKNTTKQTKYYYNSNGNTNINYFFLCHILKKTNNALNLFHSFLLFISQQLLYFIIMIFTCMLCNNLLIFSIKNYNGVNKILLCYLVFLAIRALIFIPWSANIFSCSVSIFSQKSGSFFKSLVIFSISKLHCSK